MARTLHRTPRHLDDPLRILGFTLAQWLVLALAAGVLWVCLTLLPEAIPTTLRLSLGALLVGIPLGLTFASDAMPGDWGDDRDTRVPAPARPVAATEAQREAWREMGREKFRDPDYQRYAQSHRSPESLRESGQRGFQATARKYGRDFAADLLANHRREQPTRPEREMVGLLTALGVAEGRDYQREFKVTPGVYADFAWPERKLAVEVHGGAHQAAFFRERGMPEREERRTETYAREGWTVFVVDERDLREGKADTAQRMQSMLAGD